MEYLATQGALLNAKAAFARSLLDSKAAICMTINYSPFFAERVYLIYRFAFIVTVTRLFGPIFLVV